MTSIEWAAVDASTGTVLEFLGELQTQGPLKRTLGGVDTATLGLHFDKAPQDWKPATRPGGAILVCLEDDQPTWGAIVVKRTTTGTSGGDADWCTLDVATLEAYLDRRFVGDVTYNGTAQNTIVADLIARFVSGGQYPGIPFRVDGAAVPSVPRDRTYLDEDDRTVLAALSELTGVIGGPEWTVEWEWVDAAAPRLRPVLRVAAQIGVVPDPDLPPSATFELPGSVVRAQLVESWETGRAANVVLAKSSSSGDVRPQAVAVADDFEGRPAFEYRYSPSSSISDVETLDQHAQRALAILQTGGDALTLTAHVEDAPRLGVDWNLGDVVGWSLHSTRDVTTLTDAGPVLTRVGCPPWPEPLTDTARAIGWERDLTADTVSPILLVPDLASA